MLTNEQLIDSLIVDCNNAVKELTNGQHLAWCATMANMVQKLASLRKTISNDLRNREEVIEQLKNELRDCGRTVCDVAPEDLEKHIAEVTSETAHDEKE